MVRIIRIRKTVNKFSKDGRFLEAGSFKTEKEAENVANEMILGRRKHVKSKW